MSGKFLLVAVFVAAFAAVHGDGENKKGMEIFGKCKDENELEWEEAMKAWKKEKWCEEDKLRSMAACILAGFGAWDGEELKDAPAIEAYGADSEEYLVVRKCYDWAEPKEKEHRPCEFMNCCKRENCGKQKRQRSERSIFFL